MMFNKTKSEYGVLYVVAMVWINSKYMRDSKPARTRTQYGPDAIRVIMN